MGYLKLGKTGIESLFSIIKTINVFNVPPEANRYIGPFVRPGVKVPSLSHHGSEIVHEMKFLSPYLTWQQKYPSLQLRRIVNPSSEYLVDEPFAIKNWPIYNLQ
jgi:hypothetical protein